MGKQQERGAGPGDGVKLSGGGEQTAVPDFNLWWAKFAALPKEDQALIQANRSVWNDQWQLIEPSEMVAYLRMRDTKREDLVPEGQEVAVGWGTGLSGQKGEAPTWSYYSFEDSMSYGDMYQGGQAGQLFGNKPLDVTDVRQGGADCWFVGTLCALVLSDPDYIKDELLQPLGGDKVKVNLHWQDKGQQPKLEPVIVSMSALLSQDWGEGPQAVNARAADEGGKHVLWVQVVEQAMVTLMNRHDVGNEEGWNRINGNSTALAMTALTGKPCEWDFAEDEGFDLTRRDERGDDPVYSDLEMAAKLHRAVNVERTPTTAVMDHHVVPITEISGGPTPEQLEALAAAKKAVEQAEGPAVTDAQADHDALRRELEPLLATFTLVYYNQNLDEGEYQDTFVGMKAIKDKFIHGFCFGQSPGSAG